MAEPLRIVFVCAMNRWRSPTAEALYRGDPRFEVRSAGVRPGAKPVLSDPDLEWADAVFVMEKEHRAEIRDEFCHLDLPPIEVLDVPDDYKFMDPELQRILRELLDPELDLLCQRRAAGKL